MRLAQFIGLGGWIEGRRDRGRRGEYVVVISDVSLNELELAPDHVRQARLNYRRNRLNLLQLRRNRTN